MGTSHAEGEALQRLRPRINAMAASKSDAVRHWATILSGDLEAALAPLSGPVDASGESCAYAECVWPKCREYGGYITNPLCSKRTSAPAAAVPSSPAQDWKP